MRFVILHYHILKNAGSTIEEILAQSFHEKLARIDHPERDGIIAAEELLPLVKANPHLAAVTSHSIRYPMPEAPGILFFDICFLRDPLDRVRSMYNYFRAHPAEGDPVSHLANQASLGDFIAGMVEHYALQVRNPQVNLIAAAGDSDEPTEADLELATARMMKASFLGVVDRFDESVAAGQYFLRSVFPELDCALPPVNVSTGLSGTVELRTEQMRQACAPEVFNELLRMNALDFRLVERAREEIQRRRKLVPDLRSRVSRTVPHRVAARAARTRILPARRLLKVLRFLPLLMRSPLFDARYYRETNSDEAAAQSHPLLHFLTRGAGEGRNPHALLDADCQPHPLFDPAFYLKTYPDVAAAGIDPLLHYVTSGSAEGRRPHPLFQPAYYLSQCPEAGSGNGNPLAHFAETVSGGGDPHRLFSCDAYWAGHPEMEGTGVNPLVAWSSEEGAREALKFAGGGAAELNIDDVPLRLIPSEGVARNPGFEAFVWLDASGRMQFRAAPQLRRFLQSLNYDQLRAQINYALTASGAF